MTRVLDILDTPRHPREVIAERLRDLAARPAMPDPRQTPTTEYVITRRELGDLTKGLLLLAGIIGLWVLAAMVGA